MSGVMPAEQKGAEMPREQLNTPARRVVHEFETNGKTLAGYHIMQEGEVFPTEASAHIELTPVVYLGWTKGKPGVYEGTPDSGHATFTIMIAEEEILREAEAIKARHKVSREEALSHVRHNTYCHETAKDGRKCSLYFPHYGKHKPKHGIEADRFETGE